MALRANLFGSAAMNAPFRPTLTTGTRVRLVRQTEITECGLACLAMVAGAYGLDVDLATLRRRFEPSLRGSTIKTIVNMADSLGLSSRAVKFPLEELPNLHVPAILHWNMNHYVVLERVQAGKALIHDPAGRTGWLPLSEISKHFTGVGLELRPAVDFEPGRSRSTLRLRHLWSTATGLKRALVQTLVLSMIMQVFVLASPYYMQIAIDSALPALDQDLLTVLALGFGLFTLIHVGASLLRSFVLLSAGTSLSFGIASNIARRLFRLPVAWFEKRHVGDVVSRFQSITPLQHALTQGAVAALIDGLLAIIILIVMLFYSAILALVTLIAFGLYALVRVVSFSSQRETQEGAIVAHAKEQSMLMESIRGIVTLRLFNRESSRHSQWQNRLSDAINADIRVGRVAIWQQTSNTLIFGLETILVGWLAIGLVIEGGFSVGMVFAYIAYKTQFLARASSLVDQGIAFKMLGLHLERLSDIALTEQDASFSRKTPRRVELEGRIELRGIKYRYSPSDPLVLDGINLVVEPGEHIAITGPSGGGKSTLVKIILGLLEPDEGVLLVDGMPLSDFGYKNFHEQLGAVLQDDNLFAGSVAENIALFDDAPSMERIAAAGHGAAIHSEIMRMPMGYETLVGDMGSSLSGGQKQRVLLARALYREPRLLLIDEGTSQLDAENETCINETLSRIGASRIVVAHRKETISAASKVYFLGNGQLESL